MLRLSRVLVSTFRSRCIPGFLWRENRSGGADARSGTILASLNDPRSFCRVSDGLPSPPLPTEFSARSSRVWTWSQVRNNDEGIALRAWRHDSGESPHRHEFFELVLVTGGNARHRTLERTTTLKRGDVLWVPAGAWHAYEDCNAFDIRMWLLNAALLQRDLGCLLVCPPWSDLLRGVAETPEARVRVARLPGSLPGLLRLWGAAAKADPAQPDGWLARRTALLSTLTTLRGAFARTVSASPSREHVAVRRCRQLLDHRFAEPWTLTALAEACGGLHASHLMRIFRATTGATVLGYLTERRLMFAANLLLTTSLPVGEVGARCGWDDAGYFARRFRARYGATPGGFRAGQTTLDPLRNGV